MVLPGPVPELGMTVRFVPDAFTAECPNSTNPDPRKKRFYDPRVYTVTGTIVAVNRRHRHYTVAYMANGYALCESFKF